MKHATETQGMDAIMAGTQAERVGGTTPGSRQFSVNNKGGPKGEEAAFGVSQAWVESRFLRVPAKKPCGQVTSPFCALV